MAGESNSAWIRRVLGIVIPGPNGGISKEMMAERLQIIAEDAKTNGLLEVLSGPLKTAAQAVQSDATDAGDLLNALEERIADLVKQRRMKGVREEADKSVVSAQAGLVGFAKLRLELVAVRGIYAEAGFDLAEACRALLATPDFLDDPRSTSPDTLAAIDSIGERVPDIETLLTAVEDAIDGMAAATDPAARKALVDQVLNEIKSYHAALDAEPILKMMETTPAGAFAIHTALVGALDGLASALRE